MSFEDSNAVVPLVLRFSNWRRQVVQNQTAQGYIRRQRSVAEMLMFNYIPSALASSILAPFNRIKVILQIQNLIPGLDKLSAKEAYSSILKSEGWRGLFKGNLIYSTKIFSAFAAKALFFDRMKYKSNYLKDRIKTLKYKIFGINFLLDTICAIAASIVGLLITHPYDLAYTRVAGQLKLDNKTVFQYNRIKETWHIAENAERTFFFGKYYYGLTPAILQSLIFSTVTLIGYQILNRTKSDNEKKNSFFTLLGGTSIVSLFAGVLAYPFDTLKRQMQVNGARGYKSHLSDMQNLLHEAKTKGTLYNGFNMYLVRTLPFAPIQFLIFSNVCKIFEKNE